MNEFFDAVENGDSQLVAGLLEADPSLANATDTRMFVPLGYWTKLRIKENGEPTPELRPRKQASTTEVARILIAAGANVNAPGKITTPLHSAVDALDGPVSIELVELLIHSGANAREPVGQTALHTAIGGMDGKFPTPKEVVELLLHAGADPTARTKSGVTPLAELLELRTCRERAEVVRMLIQEGDARSEHPALGPFICVAAWKNEPEVLRILIEAGADVNVCGKWGTPLHHAARNGFHENVEVLLAAGADPFAIDSDGRTPLECIEPNLIEALGVLEKHVDRSTR
jgi:ankyrin repeat protein